MPTPEQTTQRSQITNPYSTENRAEYKMGKFEALLHKWGFRTGYDNYMMDMDNRAREWETQNQSLGYEENYNSPEQQAARMRAAGMNPDLSGDMNPGQAAEMAEPAESPGGYPTDMDMLSETGNTVAQMGSAIMAIMGDSIGLLEKASQIGTSIFIDAPAARDTKEIEIAGKLLKLLDEYPGIFDEINTDMQPGDDIAPAKKEGEGSKAIAKALGLSKRNYERFTKLRDSWLNSIPGQIKQNETYAQGEQSKAIRETAEIMSKHYILRAGNQLTLEKAEAEMLKKYPDVLNASILAKWRKGIFESQTAGATATTAAAQAKVAQAEKEYKVAYAKYKEDQVKIDKQIQEEYYEMLDNEGINYWINPANAWEFHKADRMKRNADRRIYGTTSEGLEDYAGDIAGNVAKFVK